MGRILIWLFFFLWRATRNVAQQIRITNSSTMSRCGARWREWDGIDVEILIKDIQFSGRENYDGTAAVENLIFPSSHPHTVVVVVVSLIHLLSCSHSLCVAFFAPRNLFPSSSTRLLLFRVEQKSIKTFTISASNCILMFINFVHIFREGGARDYIRWRCCCCCCWMSGGTWTRFRSTCCRRQENTRRMTTHTI